jgi:hypothetical protein
VTAHNTDITAVYYTSNAEDPLFEQRIGEALVEAAGDTPIISVSQNPMDLGHNICVGHKGISSQNAYMQLLTGLKAATTKWACTALADCAYPPEYFQFLPLRDDTFYLAAPLWVFFAQKGKHRKFVKKPKGVEVAMVCDRHLLMDRIRTILEPIGGSWGPHNSGDKHLWPYLIHHPSVRRERFRLDKPCIMVKTDNQMHRNTPCRMSSRTEEIPYWGTVAQFQDRFFR